jgi:predicted DNA-binding protein with PD1-like motif
MAAWHHYQPGRHFLGRLTGHEDLIQAITDLGVQEQIATASVSITGRVSRLTVGTYDPNQQVYITRTEERAMEIVSCRGLLTTEGERPFFHAHILLADVNAVVGGRLFSETLAADAECVVNELRGPAALRTYDSRIGQLALSFLENAPEDRSS